jgi:hypothetical protein
MSPAATDDAEVRELRRRNRHFEEENEIMRRGGALLGR